MKIEEGAVVSVPGSKSIAIRVLIIAAFLDSPLKITNFPDSDDVATVAAALVKVGFLFSREGDSLTVIPPEKPVSGTIAITIRDSAAGLRFLAIRFASWEGLNVRMHLSPQLAKRPVEPLVELIRAMGGDIDRDADTLKIRGKKGLCFTPNVINCLAPGITSQLMSGLLLSLPAITVQPAGLLSGYLAAGKPGDQGIRQVSASYAALTWQVMKDFGLSPDDALPVYNNPRQYEIEPDFSAASYFWALGCLLQRRVGVKCRVKDSSQPDFRFLELLKELGAEIIQTPEAIFAASRKLKGGRFDMNDMPDQVPTLAVLGLVAAASRTDICNIEHLRYKESDRITALHDELRKIGADIRYQEGMLTVEPIHPERFTPATLDCRNDHRLVMAFALLQAVYPEIRLINKEGVEKSFPTFFRELNKVL